MIIDWNPICEWIRSVPHNTASMSGCSVPAAKGAIVRGTKAAEMALILILVDGDG